MDQNDLRLHLAVLQFVLNVSESQTAFAKVFSQRVDNLENIQRLRASIDGLEDEDAARSLRDQLDAVEREYAQKVQALSDLLKNWSARAESDHEKIEAFLATLRAGLRD